MNPNTKHDITEITEYAYEADEKFRLSGFGEKAEYMEKPTLICKCDGKSYVAFNSFIDFCALITSATHEEKKAVEDNLTDLDIYTTINDVRVVDINDLEPLRESKIHLVIRYLDYLSEQ